MKYEGYGNRNTNKNRKKKSTSKSKRRRTNTSNRVANTRPNANGRGAMAHPNPNSRGAKSSSKNKRPSSSSARSSANNRGGRTQQPQTNRQRAKQKNVRRHRSKLKRNYSMHYAFLAFVMTVAFVVLCFTHFFNIKEIEVVPNTMFTQEEVIEFAQIELESSLLMLNTVAIAKRIASQSVLISSVDVNAIYPSTVEIAINKEQPHIAINYGRQPRYINEDGKYFETSKTDIYDVIKYYGVDMQYVDLGQKIDIEQENNYDIAVDINNTIEELGITGITVVDLRDIASIKLYYGEQIEIKIGSIADIEYKLMTFQKILESKLDFDEKGILDVQVTGRAYFKVSNEVTLPS